MPTATLTRPAASAARLSHLFRSTLRSGQVHPLLHLLQRHAATEGAFSVAPARAAASAMVPAPALHAPIDPQLLRQRVSELPALPQVVTEVLAMLQSDGVRVGECAARIGRDQALTARTLRLANSAFYGVPGRIGSVEDAINLLGLRTLSTLLTAAAVAAQFAPPACRGFDFSAFWRHAVASAMAARAVARRRQVDDDLCFTAGLLHDIGRLALAAHFPREFEVAMAHARRADVPAADAERSVLGVCHAEVGAAIAARWRFPAAVVNVIAQHHAPPARCTEASGRTGSSGGSAVEVVHVADAIVHGLDLGHDDDESVPLVAMPAWSSLGLTAEQCLAVFAEVEAGVAEACQVLGL